MNTGHISLLEGLSLSIVAMTVVMIVLAGLMYIVLGFKFLGSDEKPTVVSTPDAKPQAATLEENEEFKRVAALTALVMANDNQQHKKYRIHTVRRVK